MHGEEEKARRIKYLIPANAAQAHVWMTEMMTAPRRRSNQWNCVVPYKNYNKIVAGVL
jgi:hypothetical protein